jgi:hypothetical protein
MCFFSGFKKNKEMPGLKLRGGKGPPAKNSAPEEAAWDGLEKAWSREAWNQL